MRNFVRASLLLASLLFGANAFAQSHTVTLSWTPAQQPSGITIASWNVLRGTTAEDLTHSSPTSRSAQSATPMARSLLAVIITMSLKQSTPKASAAPIPPR